VAAQSKRRYGWHSVSDVVHFSTFTSIHFADAFIQGDLQMRKTASDSKNAKSA